jgi:hypothetical protein
MKLSKTKLSVLFSIIAIVAVFVCAKVILADTGSNMYGYAWSSNIGWVKLNDCTDPSDSSTCTPGSSYGVSILPVAPGTMTGYAWSSNIGWITFNSAGCPTTGCTPGARADWANPNGDGSVNIKGWARACSVYASGCSGALASNDYLGDWDGYIALDSASAGAGSFGLKINNDKTISGFAWGSEVMGWIKSITGKINTDGLIVQLTANPTSITKGASSTLTVTAVNIDSANACSIPGAPAVTMASGANNIWTGTVSVSPSTVTTYEVTCTKGTKTASATAIVSVTYIKTPGGEGDSGPGGYCAITRPQFSWNTAASSCTITQQGGGTVTVAGTSQAEGGVVGTDGLYYVSVNLPVAGASSTYTLKCGSTVNLPITVNACVKDFTLTATPSSQTLVPSEDGKKMIATFTVSAVPQYGFTSDITPSIQSWPALIPGSRSASFSMPTLTFGGSGYNSSVLTISFDPADLKQSTTYQPIIIKGVGGGFTRNVGVSVGSIVKIKPVYTEN